MISTVRERKREGREQALTADYRQKFYVEERRVSFLLLSRCDERQGRTYRQFPNLLSAAESYVPH